MIGCTLKNRSNGAAAACRWVPWVIAAGFLLVAFVNGALAYFAVRSDPELVSDRPFELGKGYNRVLEAGAAQDALGWRTEARFVSGAGLSGKAVVLLKGPGGAALDDLTVRLAVVRPIDAVPEQDMTLASMGEGRYEAPLTLARPGQWEFRVVAARGAAVYRFAQRIVAP